MTRLLVVVLATLVATLGPLAAPAHAEDWPALPHFADDLELVVLARAIEVADGEVTLEVERVVLGDLSQLERGEGDAWTVTRYQHGLDVEADQRVVMCYADHNQPTPGSYARHNAAFPVSDDETVIYASTGDPEIVELDVFLEHLRAPSDPADDGEDAP